jgi:hypothetical protein
VARSLRRQILPHFYRVQDGIWIGGVTCVFNRSIYVPGYGVEGWLTIGISTNQMQALAFMKVATAGRRVSGGMLVASMARPGMTRLDKTRRDLARRDVARQDKTREMQAGEGLRILPRFALML